MVTGTSKIKIYILLAGRGRGLSYIPFYPPEWSLDLKWLTGVPGDVSLSTEMIFQNFPS